jgi:membrane protein YqaA with SNARE-associated domain
MEQFLLGLVNTWGYLGVFLIGLVSSATLFIPTPAFLIVFIVAPLFNPVLLGFFAGLGAAIGEMSGYLIGLGGEHVLLKHHGKRLKEIEKYFEKHGSQAIIFVFAATPLPFDIVGLFCGVVKYPLKWFFTFTLLGKLVKYWFIAFAGFYGMGWIMNMFGWVL